MSEATLRNVSRETLYRLELLESLVGKWNPAINLVSRNSLHDMRQRHILDSVQIFQTAPSAFAHWVDIGSGGGFPGLVIAILAAEYVPTGGVTLIESDARKATFLRTVIREAGISGTVLTQRIEVAKPQNADVISARALADLTVLLGYAERHLAPDGVALFAKGAKWPQELADAKSYWNFAAQVVTSGLDPSAAILKITGVSRA